MDIHEAEKILEDNFNARKGSFMYDLHERDNFDKKEFKSLIESFRVLAARAEAEKSLVQGRMVAFVHTKILEELLWNYTGSPYLKNVPDDLNEYVEAIGFAADGYFAGYVSGSADLLGR